MAGNEIGDDIAVRYLLGQLPDAERDEFEDRYFTTDALHEQLQAIEEELIDAYVWGRLNAADRQAFERLFLDSPERRQKIEFARSLAALPDRPTPRQGWVSLLFGWIPRTPVMRLSFAAVIVTLALAIILLLRFRQGSPINPEVAKVPPQAQTTPVQTPRVQTKSEGGDNNSTNVPQTTAKLPVLLAFALAPSVRGAGRSNRLAIPEGTYRIRLNLSIEADAGFPRYAAVVSTLEGREVWRERSLRRTGQTLALTIPSALLPAGDYVVKLAGIDADGATEDIAGYVFAVAR